MNGSRETVRYPAGRCPRAWWLLAVMILLGSGSAWGQSPMPGHDPIHPLGPSPRGGHPHLPPRELAPGGGPFRPVPPPPSDFYREAESLHGPRIRDYSWVFIPSPEPHEIRVHDIITIIVDEKAESMHNSRYNRTRNAMLKAELKEFVRIGSSGNLRPAAEDQPTIDGNLQSRLQSTGQATDQEAVRYRIAANVVDVLPNGNLVLEARKTIDVGKDQTWHYALTGTIRSRDVNRDNTALSENVANLNITRRLKGKVHDGTQRPWGVFLLDKLLPF